MKNTPVTPRRTSAARKIVMTGMFGAIAAVLMLLNFPVPFMPSFIKFDVSELPALLAAFSIGPWSGVIVCAIKNLIDLASDFSTLGVGQLSNFLLGVSFVLPAGYFYRAVKTRRGALYASVIGAVSMAVSSLPINYFLIMPAYAKAFDIPLDAIIGAYQAILPGVDGLLSCLLIFNLPFTLLKGTVNTALTFLLYKRISPFIKGLPKEKKE